MSLFDTIRVFAALSVEVAAIRRVTAAAERLRASPLAPRARWVPPTKMHVTLKFYGEVDAALAPALRDRLGAFAKERVAPRLAFAGFSAFPSRDEARVVFAEVEDMGDETASLAKGVEALSESLGLAPEARPYRPHLTVARLAEAGAVGEWLESIPPSRVVALAPELVLYRGDLARPGAEYEALGRFALGARRSNKKGG
jgi:2'-5' RNA ligase